MNQVFITTRADAIIAKLAAATGESEDSVREILAREKRRMSCLRVRPTLDDVAETVARWYATSANEREPIGRLGVATWIRKHSEGKVWATLNGLKRDGMRSVSL